MVKVLYILGRGRGGSTILANVLGETAGFFSAGEVRMLWDPVVATGGACGCGRRADECDVWSHVIAGIHAGDAADLQKAVVNERNILALLGMKRRSGSAELERFAQLTSEVYRRLAERAEANVIVDSSKRPSFGAFLRSVPGISLHFLHLVRDPRASAYSWKERRHASATPGAEVTRRGALDSTLRWSLLNSEAELIRARVSSQTFTRLRYEDFVTAPRETIRKLSTLVREEPDLSPFVDAHTVRMGTHHAIAGNPSRYATGVVRIDESAEWLASQSRADRWIATAAAAPFLPRYGYPFVPRQRSAHNQDAHV